jgi:hypothetical protein
MDPVDIKAKELNALEKREYRSYDTCFEFLVLGPKQGRFYPIYRYVNCLNGPGSSAVTIGDAAWVEKARVVKTYKQA